MTESNDIENTVEKNHEYNTDVKFSKVANLEYFPAEVLLDIFANLDDIGLLYMALSCNRFGHIAKTTFEERYANNCFVIKNDPSETIEAIIKYFSSCIKKVEAHYLDKVDESHSIIELLVKCPIRELAFHSCNFENMKSALAKFQNVTHLSFHKCNVCGFARLLGFRNLKELKALHVNGVYYTEWNQVITNNQHLEAVEIIDDSVYDSWEIMKFSTEHSILKKLHVINQRMALQFPSDDIVDNFLSATNYLNSLGISTDNRSMPFLRLISSKCKYIKRIKLFHVDHTLSNEIIEDFGSFDRIEQFSLVLESYEENKIPNLILSLLRKCANLEKIVISTHKGQFVPKDSDFGADFQDKFNKIVQNRLKTVIVKLNQTIMIISSNQKHIND